MSKRPSTIHDTRYRQLVESLVSLRNENGISQAQLGKIIGIGQPEVSKIENLVRRIDILEFFDWINALSELSNKSNNELLNELYSDIYRPRKSGGDT